MVHNLSVSKRGVKKKKKNQSISKSTPTKYFFKIDVQIGNVVFNTIYDHISIEVRLAMTGVQILLII